MGRPERPVDPEAGPVQRLAHQLRELRTGVGSPSYREMAKTTGISATTLSRAAAGERLPSLDVVRGYACACGADPAEWESRWKEAEAEAARTAREEDEEVPPPYRGLTRFEPHDRQLFFGRDRLTEELNRLVCDHRFAVLFGASGSGKSSLLRAGLIPRLRDEIATRGRPAVLRVLTPGERPAQAYGRLLTPALGEPESWVVVDQFEEAFTLCRDRAERSRFLDLLLAARAPDSRLRVLISVRADFFVRCTEHRDLADALRGACLPVGPMDAGELREAVVGPAQAVGHLVERELTAKIVEEVLDQPGGLPMLSHALLETWRRRKGRMLTLAAYEAAGGVRGAISTSAEEVYGQLTPSQRGTARRLLLRMIEPGRDTADTRRPLTRSELDEWADPEVPVVTEQLADARLLTVDEEGVHLAHEALISCWPRLQGWIEQDREQLRAHRALTEAARTWLEHDRDPGALYRGTRLDRAEAHFPDPGQELALTATERAFLVAAFQSREAERRIAARSKQRARTMIGVLSAVLAVALVATLTAWTQSRDNHRRSTEDAARRIASVAAGMRTTDPRTAQLLGVAAWQVAHLPESRGALLGSLGQPERDIFSDPALDEGTARFLTRSGSTLLSVANGTWRTWDTSTHRRIGSGRLPTGGRVESASPDGRLLSLRSPDGVRLWDTFADRWRGEKAASTSSVEFSGSTYLVTDETDPDVQVRSITDDRTLFAAQTKDASVVAASPEGSVVAVCPNDNGPLQVLDLRTHRTLPGRWQQTGGICGREGSLMVLGGRQQLAALTPTGVLVWDVRSGRQLADLADTGVSDVSFSADGRFVATADAREIRVWRTGVDSPVLRHDLNNQQLYGGLVWDTSRPVIRYLEGGTVHALDVSSAVTSAWQDTPMDKVLLSPDGRTLATASRTGDHYRVELRDPSTGRLVRTLPTPRLPVSTDPSFPVSAEDTSALLAFSPDSKALAYGVSASSAEMNSQPLTIWDVGDRRTRTVLNMATQDPTSGVVAIALGPDARTLYTTRAVLSSNAAGGTGTLSNEVWDPARGRRTAVLPALSSSHLAASPDNRVLAGDNRVATLPREVTSQDLVQGDEIGALAFAVNGSLFVAGDRTGRVALWDGKLRERVGVLRNVFSALPDGIGDAVFGDTSEAVSALAVSPDGRTLAVGGEAGSLQLWDIATQQPLGDPLTTSGEQVDTLAFSADGTMLYAGSDHVPLQRYSVDPTKAIETVCARTGDGGLTRAQWRTYVPEVPYRNVCGG
ncbi:helix-turn-helix domain-containing protein [Streptomyces sp. NPDC091217]|uniref:nSTAND1 domain-containing NTPase n=1 Tax=Streptomyces sp. NPDC091217 TaxID=3365975 RepID=UPI00383036B7